MCLYAYVLPLLQLTESIQQSLDELETRMMNSNLLDSFVLTRPGNKANLLDGLNRNEDHSRTFSCWRGC